MPANDLIKRAQAERAKYKALEAVKGSGYHDEDRNAARPELYGSPQRSGHRAGDPPPPEGWAPRMSERLVCYFDHDEDEVVEFVGEDARKAEAALRAWLKKNDKGDPSNKPGTERKLILRLLPRLKLETVDGQPRLSVWLTDWNDVLAALQGEGVQVMGLPLEE